MIHATNLALFRSKPPLRSIQETRLQATWTDIDVTHRT
jgi:hypothetical protein